MSKTKVKKIKIKKVNDLSIPEDYSLQKIGITQSLISCYVSCPRMFLLCLNRYYNKDSNKKFSFGNIVHFCFDNIYSNGLKEKVIKVLSRYKKENNEKIQGIDESDLQYDINVAQIVIEEYIKRYPEDFKSKIFIDVEKEGSVVLDKFKLNYKIDGKFTNEKKTEKWLKEHKTKGRITEESLMQVLTFDFQNLIYTICEELSCSEELTGVLYNIVRNPQIKPKKKELIENFYKRLREDIKDRPEFYFIRFEIPYTKKSKNEATEEVISILKEIDYKINECRETGKNHMFYKNSKNCTGLYSCNFLEACSSGVLTNYEQKKKLFSELKTINY